MLHWITYQTPLFADSDGIPSTTRLMDLPKRARVLPDGVESDSAVRVLFVNKSNDPTVGWVDKACLEPIEFVDGKPVDMADWETPTFQDAPQYILNGNKQVVHNICGVASLCWALDMDLTGMLNLMKQQTPGLYKTVMDNDEGLLIQGLEGIALAAGATTKRLYESLKDGDRFILTPRRIQGFVDDGWKVVMGVRIDYTGYLNSAGSIAHWVGIVGIDVFGINNGMVTLYNSMVDGQFERVGWPDVEAASRKWNSFSGLLVQKGT